MESIDYIKSSPPSTSWEDDADNSYEVAMVMLRGPAKTSFSNPSKECQNTVAREEDDPFAHYGLVSLIAKCTIHVIREHGLQDK